MKTVLLLTAILLIWSNLMAANQSMAEVDLAPKPLDPVKLLFIHHSVGGYWLAHNYGGLTSEMNENNYYVNDISYGWEPNGLYNSFFKKVKGKIFDIFGLTNHGAYGIGNRTDIGHMPDWFLGPDSDLIMSSAYNLNQESEQYGFSSNSTSQHPLPNPNPEKENQIIMFKSCYPNTLLKGTINDSPTPREKLPRNFDARSDKHTVANVKRVFLNLLDYFASHPDKFFVIVTPPPRITLPEDGRIARDFSNWLVHSWRNEGNFTQNNVMVFDLYNVLTSTNEYRENDAGIAAGNHHRIWEGKIQHIVADANNLLAYTRKDGDNHPSPQGLQKATKEFVPLLNHYYNNWLQSQHQI